MDVALKEKAVSKTVSVRRAAVEDAPVIFRFICELEEQLFNYADFEFIYKKNLLSDDNIYLVAVDNTIILGFLSCHGQLLLHHAGKVYEIQELYVPEEHRSKGIGSLLIRFLESIIKDKDYRLLEVASNLRRMRAHQFYRSCGFAHTHVKLTKQRNGILH